jgi:phosphopentomutase
MDRRRFVILVADSAGCGALPDAREYGDEGSDTIGNTSRAVGGLYLPNLGRLGLGHLTAVAGVPADPAPLGFFGKMQERSSTTRRRCSSSASPPMRGAARSTRRASSPTSSRAT